MTIAAVMPTFNQAEFIREAIESVRGQVETLVVVNDGSTDETKRVLDEISGADEDLVVLHYADNQGTAKAINAGIQWLRDADGPHIADWLTWVSSDNVHYPNWAETLLAATAPDVGAVYSGYDTRGNGIRPDHYNFTPYDPARLGENQGCYIGPSFIIGSGVWQEHEGRMAHDYANWLRVEEACWSRGLRIVGLDVPLCMYRLHMGQAGRNARAGDKDAKQWLKAAQERRSRLGIKPPVSA